MTPFGARVRELRRQRGITLRRMAQDLHLSAPYLSSLEHGRRSRPKAGLVQQICAYFGLIWDDAEELGRLARLSHPRVVVDTAGLSPAQTELANLLAERIKTLPEETVAEALRLLKAPRKKRP
ncbi:MAG TPA: helix-turn-helix domain-containing protein [Alphaproteobacteria bacterium]|nr:helix-turn-helix domain-containing protein [Alphaproteobacteria bacterium]